MNCLIVSSWLSTSSDQHFTSSTLHPLDTAMGVPAIEETSCKKTSAVGVVGGGGGAGARKRRKTEVKEWEVVEEEEMEEQEVEEE